MGVYAEYDPKTFELRAFCSTLNLREAIEEKRLHNDSIFHQIALRRQYNFGGNDDEGFQRAFQAVLESTVHLAPVGSRHFLSVTRAIEGVLAKINVPGNRKESFDRYRELIGGDE